MPSAIVMRAQNGLLSSPDRRVRLKTIRKFLNHRSISRLTYKQPQFKCESEV